MSISAIKDAQKKLKESKAALDKLKTEAEKLLGLIESDEAAVKKLNARIDSNKTELEKTKKFTVIVIKQRGAQDSIIEESLAALLASLKLDDALKDPWLPYFYKFAKSQKAEEAIDFILIKDPKKAYEKFLKGKNSSTVDINVSGANLDNAHAAYSYEYEKGDTKPKLNLASVMNSIRHNDILPTLQDGPGILGTFKTHASGRQAARDIAGV